MLLPPLSSPRRFGTFGTLHWLHWLVLGLSACVTVAAYLITNQQLEDRVRVRFRREADQVVQLVLERMRKYEDALWAGVSLIDTLGGNASYGEWRTFAASMRIEQKYPGINGIGVVHYVRPEALADYLTWQRRSRPGYHIHPSHDQAEYWPISYIEPVANNRPAVGLDMAHEHNRHAAARRARDTGLAQVTGPIVLVQDAQKTPGFLLYAPFYTASLGPDGRHEGFVGLVYAPFVVSRLMKGTLRRSSRHVAVAIRDGEQVLYNEHSDGDPSYDSDPLYKKAVSVPFYGRTWRFDLRSDRTFRQISSSSQPLTILLGGATIDALLLALFLGLGRSHRKAVEYAGHVTANIRAQTATLEARNHALRTKSKELEAARREAERAREAAEEAAATKATFLATMGQELRTPVNAVIATAELLRATNDSAERRRLNDTVITSGHTLLATIKDVLDLSKLEVGTLQLDPLPTAVAAVMNEAVALVQEQAREKGLSLACEVAGDVPPWLEVDALRLRQVLCNLLSNAVKSAKRGSVMLSCGRASPEEDVYLFEVRDTGSGFEDTTALFKVTQADPSTTRPHGGTGLGLAFGKRLVEAMGTELRVESKVGIGSRFWFRLRLPACAAPAGVRASP
ncbi:MAG: CHASE domain-containing protein [Myxococcales bacterium]|nr:CHASE domain-containing protein [Myxococcales bacterium]